MKRVVFMMVLFFAVAGELFGAAVGVLSITGVNPANYRGVCPKRVTINATAMMLLPGNFNYQFNYSDGVRDRPGVKRVRAPGITRIRTSRVFRRSFNGWVKLTSQIGRGTSSSKFRLKVDCVRGPAAPARLRVLRTKLKASPRAHRGRCPKQFDFSGSIKVDRAGIVTYRYERSDGRLSPVHRLRAPRAGVYRTTPYRWQVSRSGRRWVRIKIMTPREMHSPKAHFETACRGGGVVPPPAGRMRIDDLRLEADPGLPQRYVGSCPKAVDFTANFHVSKAGTISYRFLRSNGTSSGIQRMRIPRAGWYSIREYWRIGRTTKGWGQLEIVRPVHVRSERVPFSVTCREPAPAPADLKVSVRGPVEARAGEDLSGRVKVTARNVGTATARGTRDGRGYQVDLILSGDRASKMGFATYSAYYRDNVLLKGGRVSHTKTLRGGASATYTPGAKLPNDIPPGRYYLCARIDPGNKVVENREHNNLGCAAIQILPRQGMRPAPLPTPTEPPQREDITDNAVDKDGDTLPDSTEMALLQRFSPYYRFTASESYLPSDAFYQLQHATVTQEVTLAGSPAFMRSGSIADCNSQAPDKVVLLACKEGRYNLVNNVALADTALDMDDTLRSDPGSGKAGDWDHAISMSPGLYGHVVPDKKLIKIAYWQFFPFAKTETEGFAHEGDWQTLQLWLDPVADKLTRVCHWVHGAGLCFDMKDAQEKALEGGFVKYHKSGIDIVPAKLLPRQVEADRYPAAYQDRSVAFLRRDSEMHPVVYIEKDSHAFWPFDDGAYAGTGSHAGEGHSYLTSIDPKSGNLGELGSTLPIASHPNALVLQYAGRWGGWKERFATVPYAPTLHCSWRYPAKDETVAKEIEKVCGW